MSVSLSVALAGRGSSGSLCHHGEDKGCVPGAGGGVGRCLCREEGRSLAEFWALMNLEAGLGVWTRPSSWSPGGLRTLRPL